MPKSSSILEEVSVHLSIDLEFNLWMAASLTECMRWKNTWVRLSWRKLRVFIRLISWSLNMPRIIEKLLSKLGKVNLINKKVFPPLLSESKLLNCALSFKESKLMIKMYLKAQETLNILRVDLSCMVV